MVKARPSRSATVQVQLSSSSVWWGWVSPLSLLAAHLYTHPGMQPSLQQGHAAHPHALFVHQDNLLVVGC